MEDNAFSRQGIEYLHSRPDYPNELAEYLVSLCSSKNTAWDVGTGNGQVAVKLSNHFNEVLATDISEKQIRNAVAKDNIIYHVCSAENSILDSSTINLISGGQVAPWLDINRFYLEAKRVANKGCIIALFGFREVDICKQLNELINHYIQDIVGSYWPGGKELNDRKYQCLRFPFKEINCPSFSISLMWSPEQVFRLLDSYSGGRIYFEKNKYNASSLIQEKFIKIWGNKYKKKEVKIPIYMRVGIIE